LKLPEGFKLNEGMYFNIHFKGYQIAMPPPLEDGKVTFADGAPNKVDDMAHDVVTFLAWASEPKMEDRKRTGVKVVLFLLALAGLMYAVKRKVWSGVPH
ncbi:MAG TPA: cytochrome c1, partial [Rhizomicrobium sp.]|nr:cytochrome c1 [Rhizomicrobium sp.]